MKTRIFGTALGVLALSCAPAFAGVEPTIYALDMDGLNVVGAGDEDGTATGIMTFDPANSKISWSITYTNLNAITGFTFHMGNAGQSGGAVFNIISAAPAGDGVYAGMTNFAAGNINAILGLGSSAYLQITTSGFANGAVRDQLGTIGIPAPGAMCVLGGLGVMATRRKR